MPTAEYVVAVVDFAIVSPSVCTAVTVADTVEDVTVPSVAEAVFEIPPASISACVVNVDAAQVIVALGARPPTGTAGHVTEAILLSATDIVAVAGIVMLPVFRTTYE